MHRGLKLVSAVVAAETIAVPLRPWQLPSVDVAGGESEAPTQAQNRIVSRFVTNSFHLPGFADPLAKTSLSGRSSLAAVSNSSVTRLREHQRAPSLVDGAIAAAKSDDPVVWVHSLHLMLPCWNDRLVGDPVPYSESSGRVATSSEMFSTAPPIRIVPPKVVREEISQNATSDFETAGLDVRLRPDESAHLEALRGVVKAQCPPGSALGDEFLRAYREARLNWVARGAPGALIYNEQAGWTSGRSLDALTNTDYDLVASVIRERIPDGLARLYHALSGPLGDVDWTGVPPDARDIFSAAAALSLPQLVACELGVTDCSRDSRQFLENCALFGGCHEHDLSSLMRYVLARDGIDSRVLDREARRVVTAIYANDLEALGIRRAKATK